MELWHNPKYTNRYSFVNKRGQAIHMKGHKVNFERDKLLFTLLEANFSLMWNKTGFAMPAYKIN